MGLVLRLATLLFITLPLLGSIFLYLAIDTSPKVENVVELKHENVRRIKHLIKQNNPLRLRRSHVKLATLKEQDINLMLAYGASTLGRSAAKVVLKEDRADLAFSYQIPNMPFNWYVNAAIDLGVTDKQLLIENFTLGRLSLPGWLSNIVKDFTHTYLSKNVQEYNDAIKSIKRIKLSPDSVVVLYEWNPALIKQIQARGEGMLFSQSELERLVVYHNQLAKLTRQMRSHRVSLSNVLQPMFAQALERSNAGHSAVEENRALLLSLGIYAKGVNLARVLTKRNGLKLEHTYGIRLALNKRRDLMQHFLVSASLTVSGGNGVADALGLAKEISDSMGGSGFSFADLLADKAGVRFAQYAIKDEESANKLQMFMAQEGLIEAHYMPTIIHLPEGLNEREFKRRYQEVGSGEYNKIDSEIQRRIDACALYRQV